MVFNDEPLNETADVENSHSLEGWKANNQVDYTFEQVANEAAKLKPQRITNFLICCSRST